MQYTIASLQCRVWDLSKLWGLFWTEPRHFHT